ncbi:hypothetical protein LLS47_24220 [Rouxiella badensis]|uniref:S-4TM family putative pore-forming effector n=1 Tax=Rouxiella badensis TaxID=1646377 RepID=UPI001D156C5D|nr:S-4TM family putative pore-forming effector [Rouxiella badensis]MCC3736004.1 hypothetical protein [Rouxiella badensis]MCC3761401.1 hypothetical protein [Rouxiella badensis]
MNNFFEKQNEAGMIKLLAAQRQLYATVKIWLTYSFLLTVIVPSIMSFIIFIISFISGVVFPEMKSFLTVYGLGFLIINTFLLNHISSYKKMAARIQEEFDSRLYTMEWNTIVVGKKVSLSEIDSPGNKYLVREGDGSLKNWYMNRPISLVPSIMTLLCQSKNLGWDARLKRKTSFLLSCIMGINVALFAIAMLFAKPEFLSFIAFVAILLPLYQFYHRYVSENKKSAERADELKYAVESHLESIVEQGMIPDETTLSKFTRNVQDQIFSYRAAGNPVPDFIHKLNRGEDEERYDRIFDEFQRKLMLLK